MSRSLRQSHPRPRRRAGHLGVPVLAGRKLCTPYLRETLPDCLGARTPAMLAMSAMPAMPAQQPSGGRFVLGLGVSGPQIMEGWHGVPFGKPVRATRKRSRSSG